MELTTRNFAICRMVHSLDKAYIGNGRNDRADGVRASSHLSAGFVLGIIGG